VCMDGITSECAAEVRQLSQQPSSRPRDVGRLGCSPAFEVSTLLVLIKHQFHVPTCRLNV
jgi:hypothetical protein